MVKIETIGQLDVAKINPILTSTSDVANYSFIEDDGDLYLVANTIVGDNAYREDVVIPAGEYLNGYLVKAWESQKLVIDMKNIVDSSVVKGDTLIKDSTGKLKKGTATSGVYFKVTDVGCTLTGPAIKAKVIVAPASAG